MKSNFYACAKGFLFAFILIFYINNAGAQQYLTSIDGWNAYVHLPNDYTDSASKRYPLIVFIAGTGETGTDASKLLVYGPSKFIAGGHNMQFTVNGVVEKPIVISIQPVNLWPSAYTLNVKLDSIMRRFRVDQQRVHLTGLSMGGWAWDNYVDNYNPAYTNRITSIVSMSAPEPDNTVSNMRFYALAGGTMWSFEGNSDLRGNDKIRDTMNKYVPGSNRYTLYTGGHCCWNTFYNPAWTENGESIYTWMMKQRKTLVTVGASAPQVNAGNDSTIASITLSLNLKGYGNDPNGLPINYAWAKVQGPSSGSISNPSALTTTVTGLVTGIYKFELRVTNSLGLSGKDTLTIVNGIGALPVVLTDFSASPVSSGNILVQWKTSTELNSDYYSVERSANAASFNEVSRKAATGVDTRGDAYRFNDLSPINGMNYYRLKMVDKDGHFTFSKVVSVNLKTTPGQSLDIYSSYASAGQVQLKINSSVAQPALINIVDATGKKILSATSSLNKGINDFSQVLTLPRGVYYAVVISGKDKISKAFIRE